MSMMASTFSGTECWSNDQPARRTLFERWYRKCEKWIFAGKSNVVEQKNNSDVDEASGSAKIRAWSFKNVVSLSYTGIHTALLLLSCFVIGRQNRSRASREKMENPWGLPIIDQLNMYTERHASNAHYTASFITLELAHYNSTVHNLSQPFLLLIEKNCYYSGLCWIINELVIAGSLPKKFCSFIILTFRV